MARHSDSAVPIESRGAKFEVHLIDGTYELFRHYHALPSMRDSNGHEVAAVRGVLTSILGMIEKGATHLGVATDHVIESFRNNLWADYKTGDGIEPDLWPMVEFEADDALAAAAFAAEKDLAVDRVFICTPDKDLSQCVRGTRVVQLDRRKNIIRDEAGVIAKFGVEPISIPDYLALVGDAADGYPGLAGWGAKSASKVLARYRHIESIPESWRDWGVDVVNPFALSETLRRDYERALLFRDLATLRVDLPLFESVEELRWNGATAAFPPLAARLDASLTKKKATGARPTTMEGNE